jgi:hypothetical protein
VSLIGDSWRFPIGDLKRTDHRSLITITDRKCSESSSAAMSYDRQSSPRGTSMGQVWVALTIGGLAAALLLTRALARRRAQSQIEVGGVSEGWLAEHRGSRNE